MHRYFALVDEPEVGEHVVRIFDATASVDDLVSFLRPEVVRVYNQNRITPRRPLDKADLPRIRELLTQNIPTTGKLKKGEFGEVLATLFAEHIQGRWVPIYKHTHKTSRNMPVFGMDCVAVVVDGESLSVYFYEVKTTESKNAYPTVCYEIRDSFHNMAAEAFDAEIAFIWRQPQREEWAQQIIARFEEISYDNTDLVLCAFLVAESDHYADSFPVPFCSVSYERDMQAVVLRVRELAKVCDAAMEQE